MNSASLKRSIFLKRRLLFVIECVDDKHLVIRHCDGVTNPVDPFTKVVPYGAFMAARLYIMGM